ncbi:hypothetical protein CERSUDRAFT_114767 [Gelatoporia subvermispora B]|uniref:Nephrocystin 3-like N-terminal domain-containing protein n=1 Tax=Ceriporiopsis subvermispora (strain B) TaxID=914234 RepID=M2QXJ9_CERS8|nr:hypothetical protein CERSUDRAFT_114767 [Gelatoporia subvermispora B]
MSQDATLREIASAAMVIGRRSRIRDESDALLKLNPIEASYKASATDEYAKFHAGTRVELMDELRVWSQDTGDTHRIAVLLGAAGSGKSTVAHQFARRADEENLLGASIFFRRGSPHSDYQHRMIPTISYQLATSCRALRPHIVVAAQRHLPIGTHQAMEHQLEELILNALQNVDGELTPLSIVIDGADDRHDGSVHFISTLLRLLRKKTPNLKFLRVLITARPEREILSVIGPFGSTSSIRVISMDDFSCLTAHADIHLYISTELGRCAEDGTFVLLRERQNAVEKLTELSNGFFLYAATLVNALTVPRNTWVCLDIFDKILEGRAVSHSLFTRLDTTYFSVLQNAFHEIRNDPEQMSQVRQILAILARAQDQITPKTIGDLAGIKLSESLDILDRLAAVLRVDGEMGPGSQIGFIHPSFTDFISDIHRCNDYAVLMDPLSDHAWIASRCLFALSQDGALKQNPCQYENIRIQRADCSDLTKRLHENVPEYIRYAVVHWASHFRQALLPHGRAERELDVAMRQFVSEKERLLIWVETMGWMDKLGLAVEILYNAQSWCQFQEPEDHSQPFIAEVLRFVRAHFGDIDSNPGQTVFLFSRTPSSPQPVGFTPIPTTSSLKTFDSSWPSASWEGESDAGRSSTPEAARSPPKCLDRSLSRKRTSIFTADTDCRKRLRTCRSGSRDARAD